MYKKTLMIKSIDAIICDIEKKHDLSLLKYRSIEKFVNAVQSQKDLNKSDFLKLTFAIKALSIKNDQSVKKDWWDWSNSEKCFENRSMRYVCDFKDASSDSTNIVSEND
jgi:hypothetical protein